MQQTLRFPKNNHFSFCFYDLTNWSRYQIIHVPFKLPLEHVHSETDPDLIITLSWV